MKVKIPVLDREYSISCSPDARDELYNSVAELQAICEKIQEKNPRASIDKILVTAAVNLASQAMSQHSEMLKLTQQIETLKSKVEMID